MENEEKLSRGGKGLSLLCRAFAAVAVVVLAVTMGFGATVAQAATSAVSDPATVTDYESLLGTSTANIGRIWTDKSVFTGDATDGYVTVQMKEGSNFLTSLSAISSTSNLLSMSNTPLDIVLVLDASGSMNYKMDEDETATTTTDSRIYALRQAADDFIDKIAEKNANISDENLQHRVSVIKFAGDKTSAIGNSKYTSGGYEYNYSQVMKAMAACTESTKSQFTDLINAIDPAGATNTAAGMQLAQDQTSGRANAKKIVIFFTDGVPTTASSWADDVASNTVTAAKAIKDAGASIYSVSIYSAADPTADPSSTTNVNKFMHAVSSNYPSATYSRSGRGYAWSLGDRAKNSEGEDATYYKKATSADELKEVFDDIEAEIVTGAGYPTKATDGAGDTSGYITLNDELGAYMEVTDLSTLVYNGKVYTSTGKIVSGNIDTYTFEGEVTAGASVSNLNKLLITVERSSDLAVGDKVQVKIPAALIPLHHYNVDLNNTTMSIDSTTPVVVCYSSAVKSAALEKLADPDDAMKAYMQANTDGDGNVKFYANKWTSSSTDKGDAVATFEPSDGNLYYYYTSDTVLYTDESFATPATSIDESATYYYKHSYYKLADNYDYDKSTGVATGTPVEVTEAIALPGATAKTYENAGNIGTDSTGCLIVKDGTPRLNFINTLHKAKAENATATASDVLNPVWASADTLAEYDTINSYLGNNGVATSYVPTKTVSGVDANGKACVGDELTFKVAFVVPAGTTGATVTDSLASGLEFVEADNEGQYDEDDHAVTWNLSWPEATTGVTACELTLKAKVTRDALTSDSKTIENVASVSVGDEAAVKTNKVTVPIKDPAEYETDKTDASAGLGLAKRLTGRAWKTSDSFSFTLAGNDDATTEAIDNELIEFTSTAATVKASAETTADQPFGFGTISFYKPGTYSFKVTEDMPEDDQKIAGVTYATDHVATFTVNVTSSADGNSLVATLGSASGLTFENKYSSSLDYSAMGGLKLVKTMDSHAIAADQFEWTLTAVASDTVSAEDAAAKLGMAGTTKVIKSYEAELDTVEHNATNSISLLPTGGLTFTHEDAGKTYSYTLQETKGGSPAATGTDEDSAGYHNDTAKRAIQISIADDGTGKLTATTTVKNGEDTEGVYEYTTGEQPGSAAKVDIYNAYKATGTLGGDGEGAVKINATKQLDGRDLVAGEFTFNVFEMIGEDQAETPSATGTNDANGNITFSAITYNQYEVGTHTYKVVEDTTGFAEKHLTANEAEFGITVTVSDNGDGTLGVEVGYPEGSEDGLVFKNGYGKATITLKGDKRLMVMTGIGWRGPSAAEAEGAFTFTLTGSEGAPMPKTTTATNESYGHGTASPSNTSFSVTFGEVEYTMQNVFGNADDPSVVTDPATGKRSKTFTYTVTESNTDGKTLPGVTNDPQTSRSFDVTVTDNGDGTLSVVEKRDDVDVTGKSAFRFENTYSVSPTTVEVTDETYGISVNKELVGREMQEGEFSFQLTNEQGDVVAIGTNDAEGNVTFEGIEYKWPGGEVLTLSEVVPEDTKGVTYDKSAYLVRIEVMDGGKGDLVATCRLVDEEGEELEDQSVTFENSYEADSVTAFFYGKKNLEGGTLADNQFSFVVSAEEGTPLPEQTTVTNDADGRIYFGEITYEEAGTYTYTVAEVDDKQDRVTYDSAERTVTVEVTDDGEGELHVSFSGLEGLVFNNKLAAEPAGDDTPDKQVPQTGDIFNGIVALTLAALACVAVVASIAIKRSDR